MFSLVTRWRNRAKVESAVSNASAFLSVQESEGSFAEYLWGFAGGEVIRGGCNEL